MPFQRPVKRLFDLEIDEVSLVDKPANQFGKVAFSKRAEDEMPVLFDLDGNEVTEDELEHGETVSDENGNEFVFFEEGSPEYDELAADVDDSYDDDDYADEYDEDGELVGKSVRSNLRDVGRVPMAFARGRGSGSSVRSRRELRAAARGRQVRRGASGAAQTVRNLPSAAREYGSSSVRPRAAAAAERGRNARAYAGTPAGRRRRNVALAGAGGAGAIGGGGYEYGRHSKSFGGEIFDELSKALTQTDRDEAIAKALDVVDSLAEQNEELYDIVGKMADEKALNDFADLAQEYGPLPVHPARLGAIMKRAADTLPAQDVEILDRLFSSVGEQLYTEVGKSGTGDGIGVFDQVEALASDVVSKSDMTPEQAITAIFSENPDAYDEYLAEKATR